MEKDLPPKRFDVYLLTPTAYADTKLKQFVDQSAHPQTHKFHGEHPIKVNREDVKFYTQSSLIFERNQTYRIRLLNAHSESLFENMMFVTNCNFTHD